MGLPILTLEGEAFAARMAARLLRAIGAMDGIVSNLESYVDMAAALASDAGRHARYRARFSEERWHQEVGNIQRFTAEYESTLQDIHVSRHQG